MNQVQIDVMAFHHACNIPVMTDRPITIPKLRRNELRATLIEEEVNETVKSIRKGDFIGSIDGLCDILCVVYGAALEWGIDLEPFWREVHRTNLKKVMGSVREDGKKLKPPGWQPPEIENILIEEIELRKLAIAHARISGN